jgi:hypothetical protein
MHDSVVETALEAIRRFTDISDLAISIRVENRDLNRHLNRP